LRHLHSFPTRRSSDLHYTHIWIFSRKDGKPLTKEDSDSLRTNAPKVVDWVTTDANKKVIGGSNFDIDPTQMAALQKRFKVEDYSDRKGTRLNSSHVAI